MKGDDGMAMASAGQADSDSLNTLNAKVKLTKSNTV